MNKQLLLEMQGFSEKIIAWYEDNQRDLPWRKTQDPYIIWLSEVILQQTRVAQGLPYFYKFVDAFPTVQHFANATEEEVLRLWQGLGYYTRARNMHATAKQVVELYGGIFPVSYKELTNLKGVGPYTAAAIASFAYNEVVPVVDGNVFRVLARVFGMETDIASSKARNTFTQVAAELIPAAKPASFNQAIMEFGALQCTPKNPNCLFCPLQTLCYAFQHQAQYDFPVKLGKTKVRERYLNYFAIEKQEGQYLLKKRTSGDVWEGLYDFYLVEVAESNEGKMLDELNDELISKFLKAGELIEFIHSKKHVLSHQKIHANFWRVSPQYKKSQGLFNTLPPHYTWYTLDTIEKLPKSILTDTFFKKLAAVKGQAVAKTRRQVK